MMIDEKLKKIIDDYDYVSEYCDGEDSRITAEEKRQQLKDLITQEKKEAIEGFVELLKEYEFHSGDLGVSGNRMGSGMSDLEFLEEQYLSLKDKVGGKDE